MRTGFCLLIALHGIVPSFGQSEPKPSTRPSKEQRAQIERKYGMFIHFGINTFCDEEWTDGTRPPSTYRPTAIDADQWISTAKAAGMRYVILVTKHEDGFCLWDSRYTEYDVGSAANKTNVVQAVAAACKKYKVGLGLYYSLWDRHMNPDPRDTSLDTAYNRYMIAQLKELIGITHPYTPIVELWLDAGWEKKRSRWPIEAIYATVKRLEPQCQIGVNWSIGRPDNPDPDSVWVLPTEQRKGYPIRYFPSDFRMGDPYLPANPDPKLFSHGGQLYYMPWETTVCMSQKWFYNTKDTVYRTVSALYRLYRIATAQDNILILDCPPDRSGRLRERDRQLLFALRDRISRPGP